MTTHAFDMIAQHEISERRRSSLYLLGLLAVIGVVLAALCAAV